MTLGLLGVFGCVPAFDNSFCGGLTTDQGTSLRVKSLRAVRKYYAEHGAQIDHPATLAGMDRFWALQGDVLATYEVQASAGPSSPGQVTGRSYGQAIGHLGRSPLTVETITVDHASHARLELALGAPWFELEQRQLGIEFPPLRERFDRYPEASFNAPLAGRALRPRRAEIGADQCEPLR